MRFDAFFEDFHSSWPRKRREALSSKHRDPGIHQIFEARWIAGSSPAMTLCKTIGPPIRSVRVNYSATPRRILHRSGTAARHRVYLHDFKTTARIAPAAVRVR
jgi:hypothetical protein